MGKDKKNNPKSIWNTLRKFTRYLGYHKISVAAVAIMVIVSAGASLFGTYMLQPIIDHYIIPMDIPGFIKMLLFLGAIYLIGVLCTYGYTQLNVKIAQKIVAEIRRDLFKKIQTLPLKFFDGKTHGEIMSRFTNDIDTIQDALNNSFPVLIQSFVMIIGTATMIMILNFRLSIVVFISFLGMYAFIKYSGGKSKFYFSKQQKYLGYLNGYIEEMVDGQKVVKIFNYEDQAMEEFKKRNNDLRLASTEALTYSGRTVPVIVSISYFNYALCACIGGLFAISGLMGVGSLASYLVFVRQTAMPINQFTQQLNFVLNAISGAERIFEIMELEPEIDEGHFTLTKVVQTNEGTYEECDHHEGLWAWKNSSQKEDSFTLLKGDVRFHDVVFGYNKQRIILNKINLYAKPGQKIAFVGSTGAGKTTITNLINRFYEIDSGTITYDGIDIKEIKKNDLRRSLSVVLQDTHLFTGTIAENIRYGRLNATMNQVKEAAKLANADSFIRRLPNGYDTMLTGDGSNLSQGQRQLLSIARAAVSMPPVLILDEATSSIDTHTEELIEKGMDSLMEDRTVFVIAHRLSTVKNSKAIIVLEHGNIIERGSHEELLEEKGKYYQLYTGQFELS
ncbi:MAG TPA: ABC transporter ATP-binding protein [Candidatus Merdenecus merdavium]|nr:ABC transporter ATP-binding protein [Candidatus Merdenecus merdavium]